MNKKTFHIYLKDHTAHIWVKGTKAEYAMGMLEIKDGDKVIAQFNGQEVQGWKEDQE